jgi:hypothetical protein
MTSYKKTHRVRRRTKYQKHRRTKQQKRRSFKRKIVKSMKVAKWRGGGPGEAGFDYSKYDDKTFKVMRRSGETEDGWKFVVPHVFAPGIHGIKLINKDGKVVKDVSFEDLMEDNDWFR